MTGDADTNSVDDGMGAGARKSLSSITDQGGAGRGPLGASDEPAGPAGFQFDLGAALDRLADGDEVGSGTPDQPSTDDESEEPHVADAPAAESVDVEPVETVTVDSTDVSVSESIEPESPAVAPLEPLPRRGAVAPVAPAVQPEAAVQPVEHAPAARRTPEKSVFEEAGAPSLPDRAAEPREPSPDAMPVGRVAPGGEQNQVTPSPRAPSLPPAAPPRQTSEPITAPAGSGGAPDLPTLPASQPSFIPPTAVSETAAAQNDLRALRSAELRASRERKRGRLFGRTLLAIVLIGVLIAGALLFGRSYLFSTEWHADLTPTVDEIQETYGAEFDHPVPFEIQPSAQYADTVMALTIGGAWVDRVPEWRALGLAEGTPTIQTVAAGIAERWPVVYDPDADKIYRNADVDATEIEGDIRLALERAFAVQSGVEVASGPGAGLTGFTGVSSPDRIVDRSIGAFLAGAVGPGIEDLGETETGENELGGDEPSSVLPLPIAYELTATSRLGESILAAAGIEAATTPMAGPYPDAVYGVLDDEPRRTASGIMKLGDTALADAGALGVDDWSLVWESHLPPATVDRLVDLVIADSYRPVSRNSTTCFIAVFQTASQADGDAVLGAIERWAAAAPVQAGAIASRPGPSRIQLDACDPGDAGTSPVVAGSADSLVDRQVSRLAG